MDFLKTVGSLSLGSRLKRLSDHLFSEVTAIYESLGIDLNPRFFPLFFLIGSEGAQTITGAAGTLGLTHAAISKIARDMIATGILIKTTDPKDERRQLLTLSTDGVTLAEEMEPVWSAIRRQIDILINRQQNNLLTSLDEFETALTDKPLAKTVIDSIGKEIASPTEIIDWDPQYRDAFYSINLEWLKRFFPSEICVRDTEQLSEPERYYLATGGAILFARSGDQVVGCCALERYNDNTYYLTKTGVLESWQSSGIGRKLVLAAIEKARQRGATELCLETCSSLTAANHLYTQMGFRQETPPNGKTEFSRADTFMRLKLK